MWALLAAIHVVVSMTAPRPKPHRLQFGLRKLLLWTAVVALYLGIPSMLGVDLQERRNLMSFVSLGLWAIVVGLVRTVFNDRAAAAFSAVMGVILCAVALYLTARWSRVNPFDFPGHVIWGLVWGGLIGLNVFAFVELAFRGVDWVDNRMRTKPDGEAGRD